MQREQQEEGRADQRDGRDENTTTVTRIGCSADPVVSVRPVPGSSAGYWATPQPNTTASPQDRQCAQASRAPGGQQGDDGESAGRGEDDERQRPVGESNRAGFELRTSSSVASESAPEMAPERAARRASGGGGPRGSVARLKKTCHGSTATTRPWLSVNPPGEFIQQHRHLIGTAKTGTRPQNDGREGDPEASQNDVEPQRGRHLSTRRNHLDPEPPRRLPQPAPALRASRYLITSTWPRPAPARR